jgi:uncharacterized protein (DUF362 family)
VESLDMRELHVGLATESFSPTIDPEACYQRPETLGRLVRDAARSAGLGRKDPEAPLQDMIQPGMKVILKPNWVRHYNPSGLGMACMVTQAAFILAALEEVLKASPARIVIGDAPVQSCQWDALATPEFRSRAAALAAAHGATIEFIDFRRTIATQGDLADGIMTQLRDVGRYLLFDLGSDSLLEPVSQPQGRFRVSQYDPDKLAMTHHPGTHQYLLCREAFEADVILSLPKLKMHRIAGMTGALKNLVGLNGNKDYLPHHRLGGTASGGDCYPGRGLLKSLAEWLYDLANRNIGTPRYQYWAHAASLAGISTTRAQGDLAGCWHGNDTCWRMVLDLNRILLYGRPDGTMADVPQRKLYSLADAIVCGQGEGPLAPASLVVGAVTFSDCAPAADAIHAALLRMDYRRLALIREAFGRFRWPLAPEGAVPSAVCNGRSISVEEVATTLGVKAQPPAAWAGHVEWNG